MLFVLFPRECAGLRGKAKLPISAGAGGGVGGASTPLTSPMPLPLLFELSMPLLLFELESALEWSTREGTACALGARLRLRERVGGPIREALLLSPLLLLLLLFDASSALFAAAEMADGAAGSL
jgi:hypothetical protein